MWTLECDGPLFNNKKLWLRPGSSHLFGRVKQETLRNTESYILDAKSVSKKHLKLSVAAVKAGTGSQLHTRTEVIIEDFSKLGTTIDDDKISQDTRVLKGDEHVLRVARYEFPLRLKWQPVVLTIANLTKAEKNSSDPLAAIRTKLESLDIKFVHEYVTGQTTHVVATKRNVPTVLQGIIHGNYIVTRNFVDAIAKAATEEPLPDGEGEPKAPLEKDFDAAWPNAMEYVPPIANEPVKRDPSYLAPKTGRTDIFYGYTFVFCLKSQFEPLQPVINAGSGKAILYEGFQEGRTNPQDFVAFVKNVAGEKGTGELEHSSTGKGIVVVRITTKNPEWEARFVQESDRALNQRSLEQSEFLDPILTLDTSGLRKQLAEEIDLTSTARQPSQRPPQKTRTPAKGSSEIVSTQSAKPEPPLQVKRPAKRPVTQSRFKGFDDFDDEEAEEQGQEPSRATVSLPRITEETTMEDAVQQSASVPSRSTRLHPGANSRKRRTPEPENDDVMDEILPAAAAMKRRRLNQSASATQDQPQQKPERRERQEREIDVLEEAKKRRDQEEEKEREDAEKLKEALDGMEIEGPANFVEVEEMEVRSVSASASRTSHVSSARWDDKWNGRPNFKRFRRKGEDRPARSQRVMVPLEETRKKDFGIGEEYWLESSSKQKKPSQRDNTEPSQTMRMDEDEDNTQFRRHARTSKPEAEADGDEDLQIVEESARTTTTQPASQRQTRASETRQQTQAQPSRKRPAHEPPAKEPPARKKARPAWTRDESEDEDDELAFPRAKRGARKR